MKWTVSVAALALLPIAYVSAVFVIDEIGRRR